MRVAVYGTLKEGGRLSSALDTSTFLGTWDTPEKYTMINIGWFPGVLKEGTTSIKTEVYEITESTLASLDRIEGYPNLYNREEIDTPYGAAWVYLFNSNRLEQQQYNVISSGEWQI